LLYTGLWVFSVTNFLFTVLNEPWFPVKQTLNDISFVNTAVDLLSVYLGSQSFRLRYHIIPFARTPSLKTLNYSLFSFQRFHGLAPPNCHHFPFTSPHGIYTIPAAASTPANRS
jgi:hypothetical protein